MTDNKFFKGFLEAGQKGKVWQSIKSNPLAHRDMWKDTHYLHRAHFRLTDADGHFVNGNIDAQFNDAAGNPIRLRVPAGNDSWYTTNNAAQRDRLTPNWSNAYKFLYEPNNAVPLGGYPDAIANNTAANLGANVAGFKKFGMFQVTGIKTQPANNPDWYWWPPFEGDLYSFPEKSVDKTEPRAWNDDFVGKWKLNDKEKEAFIWLVSGAGLQVI